MGLLLQMVTVIADALSADEEEIILRLIARNNLKFALMEELYGLEKRYKSPAKLELEQSHTDILSPRNCPPLIEAAVFDCFVFLILAVWLVRNRHLQSCSNKGSNVFPTYPSSIVYPSISAISATAAICRTQTPYLGVR